MNPAPDTAPGSASDPNASDPAAPEAGGGWRQLVTSQHSRRRFLRGAAMTGGGFIAGTLAGCAPATPSPGWTYGPVATPAGGPQSPIPATPGPTPASPPTPAASAAIPPGFSASDVDARQVVRRYLGNLVPALEGIFGTATYEKLGGILAVADAYPELTQKPAFMQVGPQLPLTDLLQPLKPEVDNGVKVFRLTVDELSLKIDEKGLPIDALGYNGQVPGPTIRVAEGDRVRVVFTNNLKEATTVHFHGVEFDDFFQDGVPFVTQSPIVPGATYAYDFTARSTGSLMYHSHHNATDQVGRGLLGAFIVEPKDNPVQYDREYIWVSNDVLGGFTINGHGFPATVPILAAVGERVLIRFMNEGVMMHPFHSHGFAMNVVARDGRPLGSAAFECDTLGVNPGERWDAVITADRPGVWAFHCHILPHVEGPTGMFGMVTTLIVVPKKEHVDAIVQALLA
ncbi:MAG: multicopper oxidase domain-containing protein [Chloroflexota bacterium]